MAFADLGLTDDQLAAHAITTAQSAVRACAQLGVEATHVNVFVFTGVAVGSDQTIVSEVVVAPEFVA